MVFDNDKISPRQLYRLIIASTLGITSILNTDFCVRFAGGYGILCILMEIVLTLLYSCLILFLCKKSKWNFKSLKCKYLPKNVKNCIYLVFMAKYYLMLLFSIGFLVSLVKKELLAEMGYMGILILIIILMIYSVSRGVEARARLCESMVYFVFAFIIILLFLGLKNFNAGYVVVSEIGSIKGALKGGLILFVMFSPVEIILFMSDNFMVKVNEKIDKNKEKRYESAVLGGVLTVSIINFAYFIVCLVTLSPQVIFAKKDAVVSLAKNVKFLYMIFEKQEGIFMSCFVISIFFTVFCLAHHTIKLGENLFGKINRNSYVALVLFVFMGCFLLINSTDIFLEAKADNEKRIEIENRNYADSIYMDYINDKYEIVLTFANGKGENEVTSFEVNNPKDINDEYAYISDKVLDLSHVQAVFMSERILNNREEFRNSFYFLESDKNYSDNMVICATTQKADEFINNVAEMSTTPGKYVNKMLTNNLKVKKTYYKDLKILMYNAKEYCTMAKFNSYSQGMEYLGEVDICAKGIINYD